VRSAAWELNAEHDRLATAEDLAQVDGTVKLGAGGQQSLVIR
jgi:hypothetical protein